jgi:hypothetical protein
MLYVTNLMPRLLGRESELARERAGEDERESERGRERARIEVRSITQLMLSHTPQDSPPTTFITV